MNWKSDFWAYATRHVGRADKRTRGPSGQSCDRQAPETLSQECSANKRGVGIHTKKSSHLKTPSISD